MYKTLIDLAGQKFGRLIVEKRGPNVETKTSIIATWYCYCNCGNKELVLVRGKELVKGSRKSCGCLHKEQFGEKHYKWNGCGEIGLTKWNHIKSHAIRDGKNIKFDITIEFAWDLFLKQNRKCALTGIELDFGKTSKGKNGSASLDRIDSNRGYTEDNVQWVHKHINIMKQDMSQEEFLNWCRIISEYQHFLEENLNVI